MLSFGDVGPHAQKIKQAGALLTCQVQTLEQVDDAVANGVDVLVAQGAEGGRDVVFPLLAGMLPCYAVDWRPPLTI